MNKKRIFSLFLAVLMLTLIALPAGSYADDEYFEELYDENQYYDDFYEDGSYYDDFYAEPFEEYYEDESLPFEEEYFEDVIVNEPVEEFEEDMILEEAFEDYSDETVEEFVPTEESTEEADQEADNTFELYVQETDVFDTANELTVSKPADCTTPLNTLARFSVEASGGTAPYTYQWQYSNGGAWKNLGGDTAKSAEYSIAATAARDGMQLRCVVSDANGSQKESEAATLTIGTVDELIVTGPADCTTPLNTLARFSVEASGGTAPYTYQWQYSNGGAWKNLGGDTAKSAEYSIAATAARDGWQLRCVVTDSKGTVKESDAATLTIRTSIIEGDLVYELIAGSSTEVYVKAYNGSETVVVVPSTVDGKYTVKQIGEGAFAGNTVITEISLPNSIEVIGKRAFMNCSSLSKMTCHD